MGAALVRVRADGLVGFEVLVAFDGESEGTTKRAQFVRAVIRGGTIDRSATRIDDR